MFVALTSPPCNPVRNEWDITVLAPHFAAALIARDLTHGSFASDRVFEFALTYDRNIVEAAARSLISLVLPNPVRGRSSSGGTADAGQPTPVVGVAPPRVDGPAVEFGGPADDSVGRQRLLDLVESPLLEARMNGTGLAIVYLRLGNSHLIDGGPGEGISTATADRLQGLIRRRDLIARSGGDIIIVLPGLDQLNAAGEARRIEALLIAELSTTAQAVPDAPTVTIGISTFPVDGHDVGQLVRAAVSRSSSKRFNRS